ncbi:MAG: hypothetical protein Phog2KO_40410 [Phototrophicaceae bacterium]
MNKINSKNLFGVLAITIGMSFAMAMALDDVAVGIGVGIAMGFAFLPAFSRQSSSESNDK